MGMHDHMGGFFISIYPPLLTILGFVILYLVIRLAVRHGIESSDLARIIRERDSKDNDKDTRSH